MKFANLYVLPAMALIAISQNIAAADVETLLVEQCSSCHGNEVYTRQDRKVKNLHELEKQLYRCNHVIGDKMDNNTVTEVMDYLNRKFYKFK
jgi:hypothetical protein